MDKTGQNGTRPRFNDIFAFDFDIELSKKSASPTKALIKNLNEDDLVSFYRCIIVLNSSPILL